MILASLHTIIHWPSQGGYNFISGPLADITLLTSALAFFGLWWHKHNCHLKGCWRVAWHPHPVNGHPVCKRHHPHSDPEHAVWTGVDDGSVS